MYVGTQQNDDDNHRQWGRHCIYDNGGLTYPNFIFPDRWLGFKHGFILNRINDNKQEINKRK